MPKKTSVSPTPPASPIPPGMDLPRIEAALRLLADAAVLEERTAAARLGGPLPDFAGNEIARAILLPVSSACRAGYARLANHLVALIGHHAASEVCGRISHAVKDEDAALAAQPTQVKH